MKLLILGAGGVGSAAAKIAARRTFLEQVVLADYDLARAERAAQATGDARFSAVQLDAGDQAAVLELLRRVRAWTRCSARPTRGSPCRSSTPRWQPACTTSTWRCRCPRRTRTDPYRQTGVKLGDEQFALAEQWQASGKLALVGIGVEPGLADVFARYASDHLFSEIDEYGVRDGANLEVFDDDGRADLRADLLDLDHHRGVPEPAGDL